MSDPSEFAPVSKSESVISTIIGKLVCVPLTFVESIVINFLKSQFSSYQSEP